MAYFNGRNVMLNIYTPIVVVEYVTSNGEFSSSYNAIKAAIEAGKMVICKVICGLSYFYAPLSRWLYDTIEEDIFIGFTYNCLQDRTTMWFGDLKVYSDNSLEYKEGAYTVTTNA